jgi:hypothetical protein
MCQLSEVGYKYTNTMVRVFIYIFYTFLSIHVYKKKIKKKHKVDEILHYIFFVPTCSCLFSEFYLWSVYVTRGIKYLLLHVVHSASNVCT